MKLVSNVARRGALEGTSQVESSTFSGDVQRESEGTLVLSPSFFLRARVVLLRLSFLRINLRTIIYTVHVTRHRAR